MNRRTLSILILAAALVGVLAAASAGCVAYIPTDPEEKARKDEDIIVAVLKEKWREIRSLGLWSKMGGRSAYLVGYATAPYYMTIEGREASDKLVSRLNDRGIGISKGLPRASTSPEPVKYDIRGPLDCPTILDFRVKWESGRRVYVRVDCLSLPGEHRGRADFVLEKNWGRWHTVRHPLDS